VSDWRVSFAARALKSALPFRDHWRALKGRYAPPQPSDYHLRVIEGAAEQINVLRELGFTLEGKSAREMGSGWFPIMPLMYRLAGAEHVWLSDVQALLNPANLATTAAFLQAQRAKIQALIGVGDARFDAVLAAPLGGEFGADLAALGLSYVIIGRDPMPVTDVIFSHTTLEHIEPELLRRIFTDAHALLRPGGVMSHGVDHTDHRAHADPRLSQIDFLRYSDRMWRLLCVDPLDYTNRLRHSDYIALFGVTGYELLYQKSYASEALRRDAGQLPLWGRFRDMSAEDAETAWSHFVGRAKA